MEIGCKSLDTLTDGLQEGMITQIYGEYAAGKTTYCLQAAVRLSKNGKKTAFIDTENGFSPERVVQMGEEAVLKDIIVYYPDDLLHQTAIIKQLETSLPDDFGLVVVDSLVSFYRIFATDYEKRSELACDISFQLLVLSRIARRRNIPVLVTNQVYENFEKEDIMPLGGRTLKYWSKVILLFEKCEGLSRKAKIIRHPYIGEGRECLFIISQKGLANNE
ncbi:MAG: DNA repair and recombination protein RadB [Candidatus Methanofastidiosia archaeon]